MKRTPVHVQLTNRYAYFSEPYPYEDLLPFFSFHPPGYQFTPSFRMGRWDGKIRMLKYHKVPVGLFLASKEEVKAALNLKFIFRRNFDEVDFSGPTIKSDRAYQNECVDRMVEASATGGGLVLGATGSGKTFMSAMFFSRLKGYGCFVVDERTLLYQSQTEISVHLGEPVGVIGDSTFEPQRISVATVQTLSKHCETEKFIEWTDKLKVILIDEIHQAMSKRNFGVVETIEPPVVFGLTATLELEQKHIRMKAYSIAGPVCFRYPLAQGQKEGFLAPAVAVQLLVQNADWGNWSARKKRWQGNYTEQLKKFLIESQPRNELIRDLVLVAREQGKFTVVLVERIAHLEILHRMLEDIPHRVVCGKKEVEERLDYIQKFEKGRVRVILANKVFKKGINIKKIDVVIDAAGMKNKNDPKQKLGRGVRLAEGKTGLLYFDIGDMDNRFMVGTKRRRRALRELGVPFKKIEWAEGRAKEVFLIAEAMLKKLVDNGQKKLFPDIPEYAEHDGIKGR